jgi:hypothetical protein
MMFNRATSLMSRKIEWMSAFTKSMLIAGPVRERLRGHRVVENPTRIEQELDVGASAGAEHGVRSTERPSAMNCSDW